MKVDTRKIVGMGILTAIVIVLEIISAGIKPGPFKLTFALVPIVIGAALYGKYAGAWLGFVFGVVVTLLDASAFLAVNIPGTIITCLLKGALAGFFAGLVYKALEKRNIWVAVIAAAIISPIVNTGVFLLGCVVFFMDTIRTWVPEGYNSVVAYMFLGLVGINFLVEMGINVVLSSAIVRILKVVKK